MFATDTPTRFSRPETPLKRWLLTLLCIAWILPGLIGHDPWKPDEAYSFGLVYHILQSGDWVVPTLAGEPFMEKPPLYYLSAALFAKLFSYALPLHDGARLASGFYVGVAFLFVGLAGRELFGRNYGWMAALALLGSLGLLVRSHQLITDVALLAGFAMTLYGFALAPRHTAAGGFWIGTGVGIGFMSKGLIAPGMTGIIALTLFLFKTWRTRRYPIALTVALVAALPWLLVWPLALYQRSPELFAEWFWVNNLGRFFGTVQVGPRAEHGFYFTILPWYAFPALLLALWTLWHGRRAGFAKPGIQLPLAAFTVMLTVLSVAADARELYALPLLLPLALLAADAPFTLRRGAANAFYWFGIMGFTFFVGVFWFYWIALEFEVPERLFHHLHEMQPGYAPGFKPVPFLLAALYTGGWIAAIVGLKRSPERPVIVWAAGMTAVWGLLTILFVGWLDTGKSYRSMVESLRQALPATYSCIASRNLGEPQRAMLHYFAGITTKRNESGKSGECNLMLIQTTADTPDDGPGPQWKKIWQGARPGDNVESYRLYRK